MFETWTMCDGVLVEKLAEDLRGTTALARLVARVGDRDAVVTAEREGVGCSSGAVAAIRRNGKTTRFPPVAL
jgi:hypothetical protein